MTVRGRSSERAGFTLPEVLVALLIVSGLMIAALDALRAFDSARVRALSAAHELESRRLDAQVLTELVRSSTFEPNLNETALRDKLLRALRGRNQTRIAVLTVRPVTTGSNQAAALVVERNGSPVIVTPVRVDAPTPCVFDMVARRCRS